MRMFKLGGLTALGVLALPGVAYGASGEGGISAGLSTGIGVLALLLAAGLLTEIFRLSRLARGSAIAENVQFAVLGAVCLAASVLMSWMGKQILSEFSAQEARFGADLLVLVSIAFFGVYFMKVRHAMGRFLTGIADEHATLVTAMDQDARSETHGA